MSTAVDCSVGRGWPIVAVVYWMEKLKIWPERNSVMIVCSPLQELPIYSPAFAVLCGGYTDRNSIVQILLLLLLSILPVRHRRVS